MNALEGLFNILYLPFISLTWDRVIVIFFPQDKACTSKEISAIKCTMKLQPLSHSKITMPIHQASAKI